MPDLTVCLLNYKRAPNLERIIPALAQQSVRPAIFLWNNGDPLPPQSPFLKHVDWLIESNQNLRCWPRWFMASRAETPFVCSWDDDLLPTDGRLFQDVLDAYHELNLTGAVGPFGVKFDRRQPYQSCWHHKAEKMAAQVPPQMIRNLQGSPEEKAKKQADLKRRFLKLRHETVDMIKGRHLLLPRQELVSTCPLWPHDSTEDDVIVSGKVAEGKPCRHTVLAIYQNRFEDLDSKDNDDPGNVAISSQADHFARRQRARELYFPGL